jgi:hypothetical protein
MVERADPARAGVKAGRVVGLLTALLVVVTLLSREETFYAFTEGLLDAFGQESNLVVTALFWVNVATAAIGRYGVSYVVGSLVGVVYDWVDRGLSWPDWARVLVLVAVVLVVGVVDGAISGIDARSLAIGSGYVLAWLCYLPLFGWLKNRDDTAERSEEPLRLG